MESTLASGAKRLQLFTISTILLSKFFFHFVCTSAYWALSKNIYLFKLDAVPKSSLPAMRSERSSGSFSRKPKIA